MLADVVVEDAKKVFLPCVRPIYGAATPHSTPEPAASCVLLEIDGRFFGVTAAHALDLIWDAERPLSLHIGGGSGTGPVQIQGEIITTDPRGDREKDRFDFGFWEIDPKEKNALGAVAFVQESDCYPAVSSVVDRHVALIGYSIARNKKGIRPRAATVTPRVCTYSDQSLALKPHQIKRGWRTDQHVGFRYRKYARTAGGDRVNAFDPRGMSGGAVVDLGRFGSLAAHGGNPKFLLSAVFLEWDRNTGLATGVRIHEVLTAIRACCAQ